MVVDGRLRGHYWLGSNPDSIDLHNPLYCGVHDLPLSVPAAAVGKQLWGSGVLSGCR